SIRHSHPRWVVERWWDWLGPEETRALLAADNEPAELALRVNPLVEHDLDDIPGRRDGDAIVVDGPFDALAHPAYAAGAFTPQSRASQLVAPIVDPRPGERVLDLCAAPGGKTSMLRGDEVVAVELNEGRASELRENLRLLGRGDVRVWVGDARAFPESGFDRVLVDAPCSGLGVLARRPDLRWRARPLPELQLELLRAAAEYVRPGGTIVYSVCTTNADENEAVVDASGLEAEPLGEEWPQFRHPRRPEFLLTLPHVHGTSGFFVARLRA
ncbi:MAG TPA: RsmB/NOP family class I SAM-dependent RNA methyltransferase, partial [Gaiellaceae bacterium]|nr:RsmB/NOP family class I SAM-dependent RNA methyltransferase [Gaiellaceae bacterium]